MKFKMYRALSCELDLEVPGKTWLELVFRAKGDKELDLMEISTTFYALPTTNTIIAVLPILANRLNKQDIKCNVTVAGASWGLEKSLIRKTLKLCNFAYKKLGETKYLQIYGVQ